MRCVTRRKAPHLAVKCLTCQRTRTRSRTWSYSTHWLLTFYQIFLTTILCQMYVRTLQKVHSSETNISFCFHLIYIYIYIYIYFFVQQLLFFPLFPLNLPHSISSFRLFKCSFKSLFFSISSQVLIGPHRSSQVLIGPPRSSQVQCMRTIAMQMWLFILLTSQQHHVTSLTLPVYNYIQVTSLTLPVYNYIQVTSLTLPVYNYIQVTSLTLPVYNYIQVTSLTLPVYNYIQVTSLTLPVYNYIQVTSLTLPVYNYIQVTSLTLPVYNYIQVTSLTLPVYNYIQVTSLTPPVYNYICHLINTTCI